MVRELAGDMLAQERAGVGGVEGLRILGNISVAMLAEWAGVGARSDRRSDSRMDYRTALD